ncbi:hypothetical protein ABIA35_001699 [Catenulispora sp. MAP12-49]|uniref:hypothetical protein n=1 Tax=Catenulispora sp. MAP12-49 TaxID=3156302 RepID=UPI003514DD9A
MSAHARPMPNLGWDPTPGDVAGTQALARKHDAAITELNSIMTLLKGIDTGPWQGDAAQRTEVEVFEKVIPALQSVIDDAQKMADASKAWVGQLAGFQSEAATLENQAKGAAADLASAQKEKAGPGQLKQQDVSDAQSAASGVQAKAHELNDRYNEAAKKGSGEEESKPFSEQIEPYRIILEGILSPLDIVAADKWIDMLKEVAGQPSEWVKGVDEAVEAAEGLRAEGKSAAEALIEAAQLAERAGGEIDAFEAFSPGWLSLAARGIVGIRGLSAGLSGLGLLADGLTVVWPPDKGAMGWVDRGAAGINGGLIAANLMMDEIPVAGEVVMIGTGLYLAGNFLYHHWKPFTNVCNAVGHGTVVAAKAVGHGVTVGAEDVAHGVTTGAKDVGHAAKSAWHAVTSIF